MPYEKNSDLPDPVKAALPAAAQSIYRNAVNSALTAGDDEETAAMKAWGAVKNAGYEKNDSGKWVKMAANDPNKKDIEVEILATGTHHGVPFEAKHLNHMVDHFNELQGKIKPPVKLGHRELKGQPALGWVKSLRVAGNKLIALLSDVPGIVREAIEKRLYRRVSIEGYVNMEVGGKVYDRVLSAVTLLGADIPEVKDLKDLQAYLSSNVPLFPPDLLADGEFAFEKVVTLTYNNQTENVEEDNTMSDEQKLEFERRILALENQIKTSEGERDASRIELERIKAENKAKDREMRLTEFKSWCEGEVKAGKMTPAARDILVNDIGKVSFDEESKVISFPADTIKRALEAQKPGKADFGEQGQGSGDGGEGGVTPTDAMLKLTTMANEAVMKSGGKMTFSEAYQSALTLNPELAAVANRNYAPQAESQE